MGDQGNPDVSGQLVEGGARLPAAKVVPLDTPMDLTDIAEAETLDEAVCIALGAASVMWDEAPRGVFLSGNAYAIYQTLMERFEAEQPLLGFATNQQMADEMATRRSLGHTEPNYRTVDSE